jgi:hypothetical protein
MSSRRYSPLLDPIILDADIAKVPPLIWNRMPKNINWLDIFLNWILPIGFILFVAFTLKAKYDKKQELSDRFL